MFLNLFNFYDLSLVLSTEIFIIYARFTLALHNITTKKQIDVDVEKSLVDFHVLD